MGREVSIKNFLEGFKFFKSQQIGLNKKINVKHKNASSLSKNKWAKVESTGQ